MQSFRLWGVLWLCCMWATYAKAGNDVWLLDIKGPIGVATAEYLISGIDAAHATPAISSPSLIIIQMDTPGGLDGPMRDIIQRILSSQIPVVGYVFPKGARAASAGTYILYAVHVAAMSPATTLGAATPVQIGGLQPPAPTETDKGEKDPQAEPVPATTMERKMINDASAYIEGLAELRDRNSQWAVKAVRSAASLSAQEALEIGVINILADDLDDLLNQLDGMTIKVKDQQQTFTSLGATLVHYAPNWRHEFLSILTNPNVAYILMLAGVYGLFFEISNPGLGVPGIAGTLFILMALYAFQLLPINYAGAGIILLGLGLMIAEAMMPSFGIFGIGGIITFVIGSVMLIDTPQPAFRIATPIIVAVALGSALFVFMTISMLINNRHRKLASGIETLSGQLTQVEAVHNHHPMVRLQGELWQVKCDKPLKTGDKVKVLSVNGLILNVSKQTGNQNG